MFSFVLLRRPGLPATLPIQPRRLEIPTALRVEHGRSDRLPAGAERSRDEPILAVSQHIEPEEALCRLNAELRTPLNAIIGLSEVLLHGLAGPLVDEQIKKIEIINLAGHTLLSLISDMLDIPKIEAGKLVLEVQPVPLPQVVEQQ